VSSNWVKRNFATDIDTTTGVLAFPFSSFPGPLDFTAVTQVSVVFTSMASQETILTNLESGVAPTATVSGVRKTKKPTKNKQKGKGKKRNKSSFSFSVSVGCKEER